MPLKSFFLAVLLFLGATGLKAQTAKNPLPTQVTLEKDADYARYKPDVLRCIAYLENTSLTENAETRKDVSAFLIRWITGAPDVSIGLHEKIMDGITEQPEAMMLFMGGYTAYAIAHKDATEQDGSVAGLTAVAKFYAANKGLEKSAKLDELARLYKSGGLPDYVKNGLQ